MFSGHRLDDVSTDFIQSSRIFLRDDLGPKLREAVAGMDAADIWWRPNAESNSVGNLVLHLCGNMRQWIVGGVAAGDVHRDRPAEFSERGPIAVDELLRKLDSTLVEVDETLARLASADLASRITVQGYDVSRLQAVYHVVEHFSYHLGQVLYVYKLRVGKGPGFVYPV